MKVMIINPPRVNGLPVVRTERFEHRDVGAVYPPLNCLYLAAILEHAGHDVVLIDANGFDLSLQEIAARLHQFGPHVVYARMAFDTQRDDLNVLEAAKRAGAITLLRCRIIADVPRIRDALLRHPAVDIFINAEPESVVPDLLDHIADRQAWSSIPGISFEQAQAIVTTAPPATLADLDAMPFPAYHLLPDISPYQTGIMMRPPFTTILSARGCPFHCTFCSYGNTPYRTRSPENVVAELEWLVATYGLRRFIFFDEMVFLHDGRIDQICQGILDKGLRLRWTLNTRVKPLTLRTLQLMKAAGCFELCLGLESGSDAILRAINKGITTRDIKDAARLCREAGLDIYAMLLLGSPGETEATINDSIELVRAIDPFYAQFSFVVPAPNTQAFAYYQENGLLLSENWDDYCPVAARPVVRTAALSGDDLIRLRSRCYPQTQLNLRHVLRKIRAIDWSATDWRQNYAILKILVTRLVAIVRNTTLR